MIDNGAPGIDDRETRVAPRKGARQPFSGLSARGPGPGGTALRATLSLAVPPGTYRDSPAGRVGMVPRMRTLCAGLVVLALLLAGCGGDDDSGSQSTSTQQSTSTAAGGGDTANAAGKQVFTSNCGGCHTLADAGTNGQVGPVLDELKPDKATVQRQVENGGDKMPAFKDKLSAEQIEQVSTYVSSVAGQS
jgi:mono/diheme cytochrome c family protein